MTVCTCACMQVCMLIWMDGWMDGWMDVRLHVYKCVSVRVCMRARVCVRVVCVSVYVSISLFQVSVSHSYLVAHVYFLACLCRHFLQAIKNKLVFALQYPLLDNLPTSPDIMEHNPSRKMWKSTSPIALFIVKPGNRRNLQPAAIQMDSKQSKIT